MKDILDRIADSSPNESSDELICRLRDCAHEIEALRAALAYRPDAQADQDGYVIVSVKGLQALDTALDRAESKGYLPDDIADEWAAFHWKPVPSIAPKPMAGDAQADERGSE